MKHPQGFFVYYSMETTDLQNLIIMINKSKETFSKEKSGEGWSIIVSGRDIQFYFHEDESFDFCSNMR